MPLFCCSAKAIDVTLTKEVSGRTFGASEAKGGVAIDPSKTAMLCIEFQNEFATEGGKLHDAVDKVMKSTDMLEKAKTAAAACRAAGGKVMHTPITFAEDASDNPNKCLGILAGCAEGKLFTAGTWNAEFCDAMKPAAADLIVSGKKGLDAFPGTDLEKLLVSNSIETLALCGFLTNCCVESTMRTAYEKGFNVITLTDACAATSQEGHDAATGGTFGMFSTPMTAADFVEKVTVAPKAEDTPAQDDVVKPDEVEAAPPPAQDDVVKPDEVEAATS